MELHRCVLLIIESTHSNKEECDHANQHSPMIAGFHKLVKVEPLFDLPLVSDKIEHPSRFGVESVIHVIHKKKNRRK